MSPPPNELYTAFSFIGFVLCAIPLYWHLQAWNTGTCLYMIWTGLGCLLQCINSIVWNKNMINRAPVYCDISTRIQVALNVAIPACSLCINRRLYKIAKMKVVGMTDDEKRNAIIQDLLIGVGLPILQIIAQYVVSASRYIILEDFGPIFSIALVPQAFILFYAWPLAIGTVSLYYCVMTIYTFYKREHRFRQMMSSSNGFSRGRYFRLMALSATEILGTIPLATYFIVTNAKAGVRPWTSWADIHSHYSAIDQVAGFIWKNDPETVRGLEMFRWLLVACAFLFFALIGIADEARQHYRDVYTSLASRIGYLTSTLHGSSHVTSSIPHMKSKGGVTVPVVTTGGNKHRSIISIKRLPSISSISIASDHKPDFKIKQNSPWNTVASSSVESFDETKIQCQSVIVTLPVGIMPTVPPASVPPHLPGSIKSTMRAYSGVDAV